jgi:hypothetical protein
MDDDKKSDCKCTEDCTCKCNDVNCGCCEKVSAADTEADPESDEPTADEMDLAA